MSLIEARGLRRDFVVPKRTAFERTRRQTALQPTDLAQRGLAHGSSGNVSVRSGDGFLMTPTGSALGRLDPEVVITHRLPLSEVPAAYTCLDTKSWGPSLVDSSSFAVRLLPSSQAETE